MSYGLNIEMHKQVKTYYEYILTTLIFMCLMNMYLLLCLSQAEIVKRLNGICAQVLPYLSQEVLKHCYTNRKAKTIGWSVSFVFCLFFKIFLLDCALSFILASTASDGCHRESQAGHTPRDELDHSGELLS